MIYLDEQTNDETGFLSLLKQTKDSVLLSLTQVEKPSSLNGAQFELMVFNDCEKVAIGTHFEGKLVHTEDREFPDIIAAGYFGIEVKATKKDDWISIGNSVLESSRIDGIEKIYMFFGKLGGKPDVMYRRYEDCLKGIVVTHYPRYQIDMNLATDQSIFNKMGIEYDVIRNLDNPVKEIRKYYKGRLKEGEALWWIDDDLDRTATVSPIIQNFSSLDTVTRDFIKADIFVHFPVILSTSSRKFEHIPAFLASKYGVVTANIRDHFSAGGQVEMRFDDHVFRAPQIIFEMCRLSSSILSQLKSTSVESLETTWVKHIEEDKEPIGLWLEEIDRQTVSMNLPISASELFLSSKTE